MPPFSELYRVVINTYKKIQRVIAQTDPFQKQTTGTTNSFNRTLELCTKIQ